MKVENRRSEIETLVNKSGTIMFAHIKAAFPSVSEMTLRNDLKALGAQGRIIRIHGGAQSIETIIRADDLFFKKATRNLEKKTQIARKALQYVKPGTTIFMDCGTTMMQLASMFPDESIYVVTNSISCAQELSRLAKPEVQMLGGKLNRFNLSTIDGKNQLAIDKMNFDITFLAVTGFSLEHGFTCGTEVDDELRHSAIRRANQVVALMDSSKVGRTYPVTYAAINDIDVLISDDDLSPEVAQAFQQSGKVVL